MLLIKVVALRGMAPVCVFRAEALGTASSLSDFFILFLRWLFLFSLTLHSLALPVLQSGPLVLGHCCLLKP